MGKRSDLHEKLRAYYGTQIFFQPPETVKLRYPCLLYHLDSYDLQFADNKSYISKARYKMRYITKDPDDEKIQGVLNEFEMIKMDNFFTADNLNHYDYTLYY